MIRRRRVFLDKPFFEALLDPDDPAHDETRDAFGALLTEYLRGETLLYALEQPINGIDEHRRKEVSAVCELIKVRRWLRRAADRVIAANPHLALPFDEAVALVVIERFRVGEVASTRRNSQHFRNCLVASPSGGILAT